MPEGKIHRLVSLLLFGKDYAAVHAFMDAPSRALGVAHRILRHDKKGIDYIRQKWGDEAALAAQQHVIDDLTDTNRKILEKVNKGYSLNPLVIFWKIVVFSFVLMCLFGVAAIAAFPLMYENAMMQQTPEYQKKLAESFTIDYKEIQANAHLRYLKSLVWMGRGTPEHYGETYESLGMDAEDIAEAEANAARLRKAKEDIGKFRIDRTDTKTVLN